MQQEKLVKNRRKDKETVGKVKDIRMLINNYFTDYDEALEIGIAELVLVRKEKCEVLIQVLSELKLISDTQAYKLRLELKER